MTSHRLLPFAAARVAAAAAAAPAVITPPAPPAPAPAPAATAAQADDTVDVVTLADANAAVADAEIRGATAERTRTAAVLASDAGKANPSMAAFMLNTTPNATADQIIAHLGTLPAAAAAAAPAPAAATPAITVPLAETPIITVGAGANGGEAEAPVDATKFWDAQINGASASVTSPFGGDLASGVRRTGN
jgi:hypothetical protein